MRLTILDSDNWQEIFATLRKNRLRSFLTALGVFWGIFMLVVMIGAGKGLRNGATSDFSDFATNSFYLWTQVTSKPYHGFKRGRNFDFNNEDVMAIRKQIPEADVISARNQLGDYGGNSNVIHGIHSGSFSVMGDFPDVLAIQPIRKIKGRFLNQRDIQENRKVCVIGDRVENVLFDKERQVLGKYIQINGVFFQVVGHFKSEKTNDGGELAQTIFVPFTTFQRAFHLGNRVGWFSITSKPGVPCDITEKKTIALLAKRHDVHPDDDLAIGHWNAEAEFSKMNGLFNGISTLIWIVGTGTLLAGIIGVSNIMLIVVRERTREIGVKRALGARPLEVVSQVLLESVFLTSTAGYLGLLCGLGLITAIGNLLGPDVPMFRNPEVNLNVVLTALGLLVAGGLLAGLIPALKAVKIRPVEALRTEIL